LKSPICSFDAKSGVLCSKCEAKLKSGGITQDDVDVAIKMVRLADRYPEINKLTLVRGARVNDDFVLVLRSSDVSMLQSNSELVSKIEKELGQKVWFIETEASDRRFIENLFDPFKVLSVNFFWLPDSNKLTRVTISDDAKNGQVNIEKVQKIAKAVRNMELLIEFNNK
jgi:transcription antitermination factor NusA-like protein